MFISLATSEAIESKALTGYTVKLIELHYEEIEKDEELLNICEQNINFNLEDKVTFTNLIQFSPLRINFLKDFISIKNNPLNEQIRRFAYEHNICTNLWDEEVSFSKIK